MDLPRRLLRHRLSLGVLLGVAVFLLLFDWSWLRGPVAAYFSEKSGREVRIEDLDVELGLAPTVRLRGVYIENAPWAAERPFATAGEAAFTFSLRSLWEGAPVITRLRLVDADIDMERAGDGRRNWRLKRPDDRSPGRTTVLTFEAHRTNLRFLNRELGLDFTATSAPIADAPDGLHTRIRFEGTYQDAPFAGEGLTNGVLSFRDSGFTFPLRGHMVSRKARIEVDGRFADLFEIGPIDAKVKVSGQTLAHLHPFLRITPPQSRPFSISSHLTHQGDVYEFADLKGRVGETEFAGHARYDRSGERPRMQAQLTSDAAHLADLRTLAGMQPAGLDGKRRPASRDRKGLAEHSIRTERLRGLDATVAIEAKRVKAPELPMLESLRAEAALTDGRLEVKPLALGVAGGRIAGAVTFDTRRDPPAARVDLDLRDLRIEKLLGPLAERARSRGDIRGQVKLQAEGGTLSELIDNAQGSVYARVTDGTISSLFDAKLALNFGKIIKIGLRGDQNIDIRCAAVAFDVREGLAKSRRIVLDTEHTHTEGAGLVDLRGRKLNLLLTPRPKNPGLLTRDGSIRVQGPWRQTDISIEDRIPLAPGTKTRAQVPCLESAP